MSFLDATFFEMPDERRYAVVEIEGGRVRIRSLTEGEMRTYRSSLMDQAGDMSRDKVLAAQRKLITLCVVDERGNPILSDRHIEAMEAKDGRTIAKLAAACQKHVGIDSADIELLVGNSSETGDGELPTGSRLGPVMPMQEG